MRGGAVAGGLLDHAEFQRDVGRLLDRGWVQLAEWAPGRRRPPDELVDLGHHPGLMLAAEHGALLQDDLHALTGLVLAKLPALEGRAQEASGHLLVLGIEDPVGLDE